METTVSVLTRSLPQDVYIRRKTTIPVAKDVHIQPGAVKLVLCGHWIHLSYMHAVTSEDQFHCTRLNILYIL